MTISVFIVTKNEEKNIRDCLESVKWADEIVIVDSNSTDKTIEICKEYTDKIFTQEWNGCGIQKKFAFDKTTRDWVLNIDADERLSYELQQEIQKAILNKDISGYYLPFQSYYCGKAIRFGDWSNEKHLRLFQKKQGNITPTAIHFGVEVNGKLGKLKNKVYHYSFKDFSQVLNKMNLYSTYSAIENKRKNKKSSFSKAILHGLWTFLRGYFLRLGFLDGKYGFMLAFSNAEGCYYKYIKSLEFN